MALKNKIKPDHMPVNKYRLAIIGAPAEIAIISVSGLETEVGVIDLPDRTRASGGEPSASEFTVQVPMHHLTDVLYMDLWFQMANDPIVPGYKRDGSLIHTSGTGQGIQTYNLAGVFVSKRKLPDLSWEDDGNMAVVEYTLQCDLVVPLPIAEGATT